MPSKPKTMYPGESLTGRAYIEQKTAIERIKRAIGALKYHRRRPKPIDTHPGYESVAT